MDAGYLLNRLAILDSGGGLVAVGCGEDAASLPVSATLAAHADLEDQDGVGGVLLFDFLRPVESVIITVVGGTARANLSGGMPGERLGLVCHDGISTVLPVRCQGIVRVWAPTGSTVSCSGLLRA